MKRSMWGACALVAIAATGIGSSRILDNFHVVDANRYYRSAQLSAGELEHYIEKYHIRSILSLRSAQPGEDWYDAEVAMARKHGVVHHSVGMRASSLPHRQDILDALDFMKDAPRPLLVHCASGADRTGLNAALYTMIYMDGDKEDALDQLTFKTFHLAFKYPNKRFFIREILPEGVSGSDVGRWIRDNYFPCKSHWDYYLRDTDDAGHCDSNS